MQSRTKGSAGPALALFRRFLDQWQACGAGYDLDALLGGAGVSRKQLETTDPQIDLRSYYRTLQLAAPLLAHTGFFLRLGRNYDIFDLDTLGYALYSAANLRRSWDISLGQSSGLVPHPITTRRIVQANRVGIVLRMSGHNRAVRTALAEEWLAGTWQWTGQRLPELLDHPDMEVHLDYPAPEYQALYNEIFPGTVRFNQPNAALIIPRAFYERPFSSANPSIARMCYEESVATMVGFERSAKFVDEVRFHLLQNARIPFPTLDETAAAFQLPGHTLHRRLGRHGRTYRGIKLEVRMVLARQYLLETGLSIQEVAFAVGYEHVPSFVRAFRDWHRVTPGDFRDNHVPTAR